MPRASERAYEQKGTAAATPGEKASAGQNKDVESMDKAIELLEKAVREAARVEVLAVVDRGYLNRAVGHIEEALIELRAVDRKAENTEGFGYDF
jgi:hypothetical protein